MSLVFIKELTNRIRVPRTRILADSAFSSGWRCVHAKDNISAFAQMADSGGEEQDDGLLG